MQKDRNIGSYYWQLLRKCKMFDKGKLPKRVYTKYFKTKYQALRFAVLNKHKWIQASLMHNKSVLEIKHVSGIDADGNYKTEYL